MASEDQIVRRLRALIFVIFGLGAAAGVLGTGEMRFFIICFFIPGPAAYMRPRWPAIVIWIMSASSIGLLALLLAIGGKPELMEAPSDWLMAVASALLFIVVPLVRRMHDSPVMHGRSRIPEARVHRRDG